MPYAISWSKLETPLLLNIHAPNLMILFESSSGSSVFSFLIGTLDVFDSSLQLSLKAYPRVRFSSDITLDLYCSRPNLCRVLEISAYARLSFLNISPSLNTFSRCSNIVTYLFLWEMSLCALYKGWSL